MKDSITEHELIILARHYVGDQSPASLTCQHLQSMAQTELRRFLFNVFDRLEEGFCYRDPERTGLVSKEAAYAVLRGANLPLDREFIQAILDRMCDSSCKVDYMKLVDFLNYKKHPAPLVQPVSVSGIVGHLARHRIPVSVNIKYVNLEKLIQDIDLEKTLVENN